MSDVAMVKNKTTFYFLTFCIQQQQQGSGLGDVRDEKDASNIQCGVMKLSTAVHHHHHHHHHHQSRWDETTSLNCGH
jgi:hypothetical protein